MHINLKTQNLHIKLTWTFKNREQAPFHKAHTRLFLKTKSCANACIRIEIKWNFLNKPKNLMSMHIAPKLLKDNV
jgi:hypothetical protein